MKIWSNLFRPNLILGSPYGQFEVMVMAVLYNIDSIVPYSVVRGVVTAIPICISLIDFKYIGVYMYILFTILLYILNNHWYTN
jgi:hypothetical protein